MCISRILSFSHWRFSMCPFQNEALSSISTDDVKTRIKMLVNNVETHSLGSLCNTMIDNYIIW